MKLDYLQIWWINQIIMWALIIVLFSCAITDFIYYGKIKQLQSQVQERKQHEEQLARIINPDFRDAIKEFTKQVKIENYYLASFKDKK